MLPEGTTGVGERGRWRSELLMGTCEKTLVSVYYGPMRNYAQCIECKKHGHHSSMSYLTQMVNERRQAACGLIGFRNLSDRNKSSNYVTGFLSDMEADKYDLTIWRFNPSNSFTRPLNQPM